MKIEVEVETSEIDDDILFDEMRERGHFVLDAYQVSQLLDVLAKNDPSDIADVVADLVYDVTGKYYSKAAA